VRALVVVSFLCGIATAAPKYQHTVSTSTDPAMVAAERAWTVAAASRGPAQSDLWQDAASAFVKIIEARTLRESELALAARSALAAAKNSLDVDPRVRDKQFDPDFDRVPTAQEITSRDQRMIHLLEVVARFVTDADELAGLSFLRANIWRRYNRFDKALPIFLDLLDHHRDHEVAEYAANLLLDTYNRMQQYDDLVALAKKLRADKAFLANHPGIATTVDAIYANAQGLVARDAITRARETGDRSYFDRCAAAYLEILEGASRRAKDDEVLYNAMTCFEQAGNTARTLEMLRRLVSEFPDSILTKRAELHAIYMLAIVGRVDEAAAAGERWLRTNATEPDAPDVLDETIRWRAATGTVDDAVRVLETYASRVKRVPLVTERTAAAAVALASLVLDDARTRSTAEYAGRRAIAVRILARPPPLSRTIDNDPQSRLDVVRVYATAACPIALVDGMCLRPRDPALMATARRELARIANPFDGATLFLADLALEAILAGRAPTANLAADYRHLAESASADIRIAAFARLAALAHHANDERERTTQLEACVAEANAARDGDAWRAICERDLGGPRDRMPPPRAPAPLVLEMLPRPLPAIQPTVPTPVDELDFE